MNILSKELLYKHKTPPTPALYEAYYVNNSVLTLLGDVSDLSRTFGPDDFIYTNLFVYDGELYVNGSRQTTGANITSVTGRTSASSYYSYFVDDGKMYRVDSDLNITRHGSATDWIKVCGYTGTSGNYRAFAEASDGIWYINPNGTNLRSSTLTGWSKITGYGSISSSAYYGYGINGGALYYIYADGTGVVQQGTETTWTDITGSREGTSWYGYGINNGKLYKLSGTPSQVGSSTSWTKISGTASGSAKAFGINGGGLYSLSGTSATQIGSSTDWTNCSGYADSSRLALACDSNALYTVNSSGTLTKIADGEYIYLSGNVWSSSAYAIVIKRKQQ